MLMMVSAKNLHQYKVFRVKAGDTSKVALLVDPAEDETAFSAAIEIFDAGGRTPPVLHDDAERLFYALHGAGTVIVHQRRIPLHRGAAFVVHAGEEYVIENTGQGRLYCLTAISPDNGFFDVVRSGIPDRLDEEDLRILGGR